MKERLKSFMGRHSYRPELQGNVGVEREAFLTDHQGRLVPKAHDVLATIETNGIPTVSNDGWVSSVVWEPAREGEFSYELSACQVETRIGPCTLTKLPRALHRSKERLDRVVAHHGLKLLHTEVGPVDMPLDVYPDPTGRYQEIVKRLSKRELLAGCRVIGTHVHVGMPDHETALKTYNYVIQHTDALCEAGNGSFGERLAIYRQMAPDFEPLHFSSWEGYHAYACQKGFEEDPRKCWSLIRMSVHGTIEFRMFGATRSISRIGEWAKKCHALCMEAQK